MELTYQRPMMPAVYTAISEDEMTYIDGGAIALPTLDDVIIFGVNFTFNVIRTMGRAAFSNAYDGLKEMHGDGLSLTQSIDYYWNDQTTAGKVGTVVVGAFAGYYVYGQVMQIYKTVKSIYTDLKNAYELYKAQKAQETAATQEVGLPDPIVAAAA